MRPKVLNPRPHYTDVQVPYAGLNGIQAALAVMERRLHAPLTLNQKP